VSWLRRLWPWHEHIYSFRFLERNFRCRCGKEISGDELFDADTMLGRHWRERYSEQAK